MYNHVPVHFNHPLIFQDFIILNLRNVTYCYDLVIMKEKDIIELWRTQTKTTKTSRDMGCLSYIYRAK